MRPTHIEDYLITVRTGQWFGWTDSKTKSTQILWYMMEVLSQPKVSARQDLLHYKQLGI